MTGPAARRRLLTPLVLAGLVLTFTSCTGTGSGEDGSDVNPEAAERATLSVLREAVPIALRAVGGEGIRAEAGWSACMPRLSWKYDGAGVFSAPEGDTTVQFDAIRTALVDVGFTDVTQVAGQVAVARDGVTLALSPHHATEDPSAWQLSFQTECLTLSGDAARHADSDTRSQVDGLE